MNYQPPSWQLIARSAMANLSLTINAQESDRLELLVKVLETQACEVRIAHPDCQGFGHTTSVGSAPSKP